MCSCCVTASIIIASEAIKLSSAFNGPEFRYIIIYIIIYIINNFIYIISGRQSFRIIVEFVYSMM